MSNFPGDASKRQVIRTFQLLVFGLLEKANICHGVRESGWHGDSVSNA